ncbi:hypothetical protein QE152_g31878 [Popillia japonica]|uniref:Uncharacterized protein n=1 Tax=Popillia japonica TaxID=7064 RepID=A0AAW1J0T3_POPJA
MVLAPKKTEGVIRKRDYITFKLGGVSIAPAKSIGCLEFTVDEKLRFGKLRGCNKQRRNELAEVHQIYARQWRSGKHETVRVVCYVLCTMRAMPHCSAKLGNFCNIE